MINEGYGLVAKETAKQFGDKHFRLPPKGPTDRAPMFCSIHFVPQPIAVINRIGVWHISGLGCAARTGPGTPQEALPHVRRHV